MCVLVCTHIYAHKLKPKTLQGVEALQEVDEPLEIVALEVRGAVPLVVPQHLAHLSVPAQVQVLHMYVKRERER